MKQLLHSKNEGTIMAFHERSFVYFSNSNRQLELLPVECRRKDLKENPIQAVAINADTLNAQLFWCAVSRADKTLLIYKIENIDMQEKFEKLETLTPTTIHNTPKRVGCMCFAQVQEMLVLLAGDFTGDAWAISLEKKAKQSDMRLLLGHTASMLTGIAWKRDVLLTSDRDEKIRVTSFPNTTIIQGFLLGHAAYVSSMDVAQSATSPLCVTCSGGDGTIKLWNFESMQQLDSWKEDSSNNHNNKTPCRVAMDHEGTRVAVIYDQSTTLDVLRVKQDVDGKKFLLTWIQTIQFTELPVSVTFYEGHHLFVITKDPTYLQLFQRTPDKDLFEAMGLPVGLSKLQAFAKEHNLKMPDSVLEKDKEGQVMMEKVVENRGSASAPEEELPWNRTERVQIAKERNRRHKKRRMERKQAGTPEVK